MTLTPFNPDDWLDVVVLFGLGLMSLVGVLLPVWWSLHTQGGHIKTIKHEVKNDHDTNYRDDFDKLVQTVEKGFSEMNSRIADLHTDIQQERQDRMEGDRLRLITGGARR